MFLVFHLSLCQLLKFAVISSANQKLKQMVADQQEAEKRKVMSQELHKDLKAQQKKIAQKQREVMEDLAKVEPAVQEAQQGEMNIGTRGLMSVVLHAAREAQGGMSNAHWLVISYLILSYSQEFLAKLRLNAIF